MWHKGALVRAISSGCTPGNRGLPEAREISGAARVRICPHRQGTKDAKERVMPVVRDAIDRMAGPLIGRGSPTHPASGASAPRARGAARAFVSSTDPPDIIMGANAILETTRPQALPDTRASATLTFSVHLGVQGGSPMGWLDPAIHTSTRLG